MPTRCLFGLCGPVFQFHCYYVTDCWSVGKIQIQLHPSPQDLTQFSFAVRFVGFDVLYSVSAVITFTVSVEPFHDQQLKCQVFQRQIKTVLLIFVVVAIPVIAMDSPIFWFDACFVGSVFFMFTFVSRSCIHSPLVL